jgi:Ca-activated chloride channel family protein
MVKGPAPSADIARDTAFATAVAGFGQHLQGGKYTGVLSLDDIIRQAQSAKGDDFSGYRAEFIELVEAARKAQAR